MHVHVESGGYGLIRIEELIRKYEAQMNRTTVWALLGTPKLISGFVRRFARFAIS
jgi:hypothetical protein